MIIFAGKDMQMFCGFVYGYYIDPCETESFFEDITNKTSEFKSKYKLDFRARI